MGEIEALENAIFVPDGINETSEARRLRLRSAIELARSILDTAPAHDRALTLMGIALYFIGSEESSPATDANFWLEEAIRLNPANHEAVLYLGYSCFDASNFGDALTAFNRFRSSSAYETAFEWLKLKVEELILAARIHLEPEAVTCREVMDLNKIRRGRGHIECTEPTELLAALRFDSAPEASGDEI